MMRLWLEHVASLFETIRVVSGNHERRLFYALEGFHAPQFMRLIADNRRTQFSIYTEMTLTSGGVTWRCVHPHSYSRLPGSIGRKLADKYDQDMIVGHLHCSCVGRNTGNRRTFIESGGLHQSNMLAYAALRVTTAPVMSNGFVLVKDGAGLLFTPPEYHLVDYSKWL